jgi:hypothetical protein
MSSSERPIKRLARILPTVVGIGFCLIEAMKVAFQVHATDVKDPASGHVEAIRFAPVISSDWDYITTPQMIALSVVMVAVMLLAAVMLTSKWWGEERRAERVSRSGGPAKTTNAPSPSEAPGPASVHEAIRQSGHQSEATPTAPPGRPAFGRGRH